MNATYQVFDSSGRLVLDSDVRCRYSRSVELSLLDAGYIVKVAGKKLTKTEIRKGPDIK
jgi:hypothetical protein